jgi:hypothetical protein
LNRIGRSGVGQTALMRLAQTWPGGLRVAVRLTRLPDQAVARLLAIAMTQGRTSTAGPRVTAPRRG